MIGYTDSIAFGERVVPDSGALWTPAAASPPVEVAGLLERLFGGRDRYTASIPSDTSWPCLIAVESAGQSQFDTLVALGREGGDLPDGVACLAGAGGGLHGQRGRPWAALPGNLHLSLWLAPPRDTVRSPIELLALAAVSVVDAIDTLPGLRGRAGIKWVNDILIDGAKVCGILTHVESRPTGIRASLGIGMNVESVPQIAPTPFVPAVAALRTVAADPAACRLGSVLREVLRALDHNYDALRSSGAGVLLARYRERSLVLGREVALCDESGTSPPRVIAEGRVAGLGPQLELVLEGHPQPFTTGRLLLRRT